MAKSLDKQIADVQSKIRELDKEVQAAEGVIRRHPQELRDINARFKGEPSKAARHAAPIKRKFQNAGKIVRDAPAKRRKLEGQLRSLEAEKH